MAVTVHLPSSLRGFTRGTAQLTVEARTVGALFDALEVDYPALVERVRDTRGIRRFVNVYVNDEDVRFLEGAATPLREGDVVTIVPAIAGGT